MPFFKTNKDIFKKPDEEELYNENDYDTNFLVLPPTFDWDYKRELQIEDIDIWEQIFFSSGGTALYAAYRPYAEFYLLTVALHESKTPIIETFYGKLSWKKALEKSRYYGMPIQTRQVWVDNDKMWLYT